MIFSFLTSALQFILTIVKFLIHCGGRFFKVTLAISLAFWSKYEIVNCENCKIDLLMSIVQNVSYIDLRLSTDDNVSGIDTEIRHI